MPRFFQAALAAAALLAFAGCTKPAEPSVSSTSPQTPAPAARPAAEASPASNPSAPPASPPRVTRFEAGTPLVVRTTTAIDTSQAKNGDRWVGNLDQPLLDGDLILAPKGAAVTGVVVSSDPGGRVKGRASLVLAVTSLELSGGRTVDVSTTRISRAARGTVKRDAIRTGIASGVGAAIGALAGGGKGAAIGAGAGAAGGTGVALATRGDPARVPAESVLRFKLSAPLQVTETR